MDIIYKVYETKIENTFEKFINFARNYVKK